MIPEDKIVELVDAHSKLGEDPTTGAIWISPEASEAWLVEVVPSMTDDEAADEAIFFSPGVEFRFPIAIIAGNRSSLEAALRRKPELARLVAAGKVMFDTGDAKALVAVAREIARAA